MKKSYITIVAVLIIGITTVGVMIALQPTGPDFSDLSWAVQVNDTFDFELVTWSSGYYAISLTPLNNTIIRVQVENLTSLDSLASISDFTTQVIQNVKISATFVNGTALTYWATERLLPAISGCILPIGSWSTIDSLYPDTIPEGWEPSIKKYATKLYDDYLHIIHKWTGSIDDGGGWDGIVLLTDGFPSVVHYNYNHAGSENYGVVMTLVT